MPPEKNIDQFLSLYPEHVFTNALQLRELLFSELPDIIEQLDLPARIIGYSYSNKYDDVICVIIPSKKGLKLGFNRGTQLPDPDGLLQGTGKIARYVVIGSAELINSPALRSLIATALEVYKQRVSKK